jgi:hypothetical protein
MGGHEERELSSVFQVLPQFALKARGIVSMRGWEMRWRILIMQSEGDEGGICVVAESCHQTSEAVGLMASWKTGKTIPLFTQSTKIGDQSWKPTLKSQASHRAST